MYGDWCRSVITCVVSPSDRIGDPASENGEEARNCGLHQYYQCRRARGDPKSTSKETGTPTTYSTDRRTQRVQYHIYAHAYARSLGRVWWRCRWTYMYECHVRVGCVGTGGCRAADVWGRLSGSQESVAGVSGRSDREHAPMIGLATALEAVAWLYVENAGRVHVKSQVLGPCRAHQLVCEHRRYKQNTLIYLVCCSSFSKKPWSDALTSLTPGQAQGTCPGTPVGVNTYATGQT